ncbi:hypothetical protein EVAR_53549_1 [Eumeta japonica]|uniref:Uncharacterized protein n=1 Tax=Eumeta variegata TaxID=151549 RepID=A0A4C1YTB2_EUMVA|nr:hypothetical protein EVAR_53549_1 [Eumeta japonica]
MHAGGALGNTRLINTQTCPLSISSFVTERKTVVRRECNMRRELAHVESSFINCCLTFTAAPALHCPAALSPLGATSRGRRGQVIRCYRLGGFRCIVMDCPPSAPPTPVLLTPF